MIDLIRNEMKKMLLHRLMYLPLLCCIAGFVVYLIDFSADHQPVSISYTEPDNVQAILTGLQEGGLREAADTDAVYEVAKYKYIQTHDLRIPTQGWQMSALNDAFHIYQKRIQEEAQSPHQTAACYRYLKLLCQAAAAEDTQSYLKLLAEQAQTDESLSASEKYSYGLYYSYMIASNVIPETDDWRNTAAKNLLNSRLSLALLESTSENDFPSYDRLWKDAYNKQAISEYQISHEIPLLVTETQHTDSLFWHALFSAVPLLLWLQIPLVFLMGGMVSYEREHGQLSLLLTCPVNRSKYFLAKIVTIFLLCIGLIVCAFLLFLLLAGILFGFQDLSAQALYVYDGQVISFGTILLLLRQFLFACLSLFACGSFVLFCSTLFRHTTLVWLSGCIYAWLTLTVGCQTNRHHWLTHTIWHWADLSGILMQEGTDAFYKALFLLILHMLICLSGSWLLFCRRQSDL